MNWNKRYAADKKPRTWKNVQNSTPVPAQPVTNSQSGRTWKKVQPIKDAPKPVAEVNYE